MGVWLLKAAYTGIAALLVDGKTLHFIGKMKIRDDGQVEVGPKMKAKLQKFWRYRKYLIIDEYSMISKPFLAKLSKHIAVAKAADDPSVLDFLFGGINVLFAGDLHQFPPVGVPESWALFTPESLHDSALGRIGASIYREFETVVILREQKRVTDPVWQDFLEALRVGQIQPSHLSMLRTLLLQPVENEQSTQFDTTSPWLDAPLVTPRHCICVAWNSQALRCHCQRAHQRLFICPADETIKGKPLSNVEKQALKNRPKRRGTGDGFYNKELPEELEIAVGARVLVTQNLQTDLDVANGSRGTIVGVLLHPDEPPLPDMSIVRLKFLPICILVKMDRTRAQTLPGLDPGVIPIQPIEQRIVIEIPCSIPGRKSVRRTVVRRQFPMTGAYAFTDYRSQGQTISYVIVDIQKPPSGRLNLFNLYVALSRSRGRDTIRLLRDFDDFSFLRPHNTELLAEDDRLEALAQSTRLKWHFLLNI